MASKLPRLAAILALLIGMGWAVAGAPGPAKLRSAGVLSAPVARAVESTPTPSALDGIPFFEGGGHGNNVEALSHQDGRFEFDGRADYVRDVNNDVTESNLAVARATC